MTDRFFRTAQRVRAALVSRGTPVPPVASTLLEVRKQLAEWIPLLHMAPPLTVKRGKVLVLPQRVRGQPTPRNHDGTPR